MINYDVRDSNSGTMIISKEVSPQDVTRIKQTLQVPDISDLLREVCNTNSKDLYFDLVRGNLKPQRVVRGRVTCLLSISLAITNAYGSMHGAAVAAVAEMVSIACARTMVAEDKELFLGEQSISYLSAAQTNAEVIVDGTVVRSGRNLTVVAVEFKLKETEQLVYTARATFYNMPLSKL
ncbi:hypothetical protein I3843_02G020900 [Carya illinoinensis]|uniref:Thioesterase domain-containing protein n=1 Tax=Carya illinoinensis TaxID=32201 RepID=A0A8T1R991_CARIL|nr:uncharacterized protein LOC122298293 [Carya illinoinensis]KAG2720241.1 hypothetical protein I3760_02G027900 [Carya illinoinensis]KAG6663437.1 hypothetical protein CIPAW_02G026900 [Carya illinoinensis]KAG6725318.1 hypothetical protein I3842_02G027200 [Carya illinoinensis]KAG7990329.1 hypothetical protein I3843_02G020900 [Carya illinoinensis]